MGPWQRGPRLSIPSKALLSPQPPPKPPFFGRKTMELKNPRACVRGKLVKDTTLPVTLSEWKLFRAGEAASRRRKDLPPVRPVVGRAGGYGRAGCCCAGCGASGSLRLGFACGGTCVALGTSVRQHRPAVAACGGHTPAGRGWARGEQGAAAQPVGSTGAAERCPQPSLASASSGAGCGMRAVLAWLSGGCSC